MVNPSGPVDVSQELAMLKHERKNQSMKRLPPNSSIQKRPLGHPAIPPPQAGAKVQKVVYISCRTPVISAVKRVKKLLEHIEKRALQGLEATNGNKAQVAVQLAELSNKLAKSPEEILVKASGRAMQQALKVAEWFRTKEKDFMCNVEVRTGSVAAIDDIVIRDEIDTTQDVSGDGGHETLDQAKPHQSEDTTLEGGDTTMDILGDQSVSEPGHSSNEISVHAQDGDQVSASPTNQTSTTKRRRKKRKRASYNAEDVPEARVRWVKTVEVAISLKA